METREDNGPMESVRSHCFELAAAAFSKNELDLERYESVAGEIAGAEKLSELQSIQKRLPRVELPAPPKPQLINAESSTLKRKGRWIDSTRIKLYGTGSNIRLDFTAYSSEANLRIEVELECRSSKIKLVVPRNIDVVERIESSRMSVFRDRHRKTESNSAIVVSGNLSSSLVKIKRKKVR